MGNPNDSYRTWSINNLYTTEFSTLLLKLIENYHEFI